MEKVCTDCRALMWVDKRKSNSSCTNPKFTICCSNSSSRVQLPPLPNRCTPFFLDPTHVHVNSKKDLSIQFSFSIYIYRCSHWWANCRY